MEDLIVRYSGRYISPEFEWILSPEERREGYDSILNNPRVKHRFVWRQWPRPHAVIDWKNIQIPLNEHPIIKPENSQPGKMAPNRVQLWGSTLFDFFGVQRVAGMVHQRSLSTGSKLLRWCKANGEYEGVNVVAKDCIAWAEKEKDPELVPVYNVANLIKNLEHSAFYDAGEEDTYTDIAEKALALRLPQPVSHRKSINHL